MRDYLGSLILSKIAQCFVLTEFQEGSIGHDVVIKPVPFGLMDHGSFKNEERAHHIVYKRQVNEVDEFSDFGRI